MSILHQCGGSCGTCHVGASGSVRPSVRPRGSAPCRDGVTRCVVIAGVVSVTGVVSAPCSDACRVTDSASSGCNMCGAVVASPGWVTTWVSCCHRGRQRCRGRQRTVQRCTRSQMVRTVRVQCFAGAGQTGSQDTDHTAPAVHGMGHPRHDRAAQSSCQVTLETVAQHGPACRWRGG